MGIRKGEPAVVEIRFICRECGGEEIRGRRWWRKYFKQASDQYKYETIQSYVCGQCATVISKINGKRAEVERLEASILSRKNMITMEIWELEKRLNSFRRESKQSV